MRGAVSQQLLILANSCLYPCYSSRNQLPGAVLIPTGFSGGSNQTSPCASDGAVQQVAHRVPYAGKSMTPAIMFAPPLHANDIYSAAAKTLVASEAYAQQR